MNFGSEAEQCTNVHAEALNQWRHWGIYTGNSGIKKKGQSSFLYSLVIWFKK